VFSQCFISNFFLLNISSKILKHASKDPEFYGESCGIFEISAELLFRKIYHLFFVFHRRSWMIE
jgi:hypothetical protein